MNDKIYASITPRGTIDISIGFIRHLRSLGIKRSQKFQMRAYNEPDSKRIVFRIKEGYECGVTVNHDFRHLIGIEFQENISHLNIEPGRYQIKFNDKGEFCIYLNQPLPGLKSKNVA